MATVSEAVSLFNVGVIWVCVRLARVWCSWGYVYIYIFYFIVFYFILLVLKEAFLLGFAVCDLKESFSSGLCADPARQSSGFGICTFTSNLTWTWR